MKEYLETLDQFFSKDLWQNQWVPDNAASWRRFMPVFQGTTNDLDTAKQALGLLRTSLPWTNSADNVPVDGKYLVYYEESQEYKICDLNGRVFSYTYFKDGEEMIAEFYPNQSLWWCALKFNNDDHNA